MTQPAKVQEPSMEEILASIRRIIADDEGKPEAAEKPASPAAAAKPEKSPTGAPPARPPAVSNSQDDIDAMLAGLDEATSEAEIRPAQPESEVFELTDEMAVPDAPQPPFQTIEPEDDLEFTEMAAAKTAPRQP